jgi:hypothetical protein
MKNFAYSTLIFLFCKFSFAEDFRTLSFGESCDNIEAGEQLLGSQRNQDSTDILQVYDGVHLDRAVTIVYLCDEQNELKKGVYNFRFTTELGLDSFFDIARPQLEYQFGEANFSGAELKNVSAAYNVSEAYSETIKFLLKWETEHIDIQTNASGNFDEPNPEKLFTISFKPIH